MITKKSLITTETSIISHRLQQKIFNLIKTGTKKWDAKILENLFYACDFRVTGGISLSEIKRMIAGIWIWRTVMYIQFEVLINIFRKKDGDWHGEQFKLL